ncbi:MAG TPA: hypothetical protein VM261_06020 [Kofleriaceae bacterium]|nr:hypothetical protein [Kofleriaceae bacterium]
MNVARFGLVLILVAIAGDARAQDSPVAEKLFREGKRLLGEGKIAEACKSFEGSYRKDPAVTTLLNLADCRERNKQYATAWGYFLDVVRIARERPESAAFGPSANARAARLEQRLSYLIINVPAEAQVEGLQITRNGVVVDEAEWNTDIPVDGGDYVIEGRAPGFDAWSTRLSIVVSGDRRSVNVPKFRSRPATDMAPVTERAVGAPVPERSTESGTPGGEGGNRTRAVAIMAAGGVVLAGGLTVGYLAQQKWWEAEKVCGDDHVCDDGADRAETDALIDAARTRGTFSTVMVGAGLAGVGIGTFLFVRARRSDNHASGAAALRVTPVVSRDGASLIVERGF